MKTIEELLSDHCTANGLNHLDRDQISNTFMAGAAAMASLFAAGMAEQQQQIGRPPSPDRLPPPQCVHGVLFKDQCQHCDASSDGNTRIMPLAGSGLDDEAGA